MDDYLHGKTRGTAMYGSGTSFTARLKDAKVRVTEADGDPWRLRLERLRGQVGYDGIERLSSQAIMDVLEIPQRARGAGTCRRLAKVMRELGWTPIRVRDFTRGGYRESVRGYCRDAKVTG
ncbi:MAG: hypothetical protein IT537_28870 [Hyphomicrobiales bacterium]|nr:hypothetical protein [Hyphomicrobiales bacterium]